MRTKIIRDFMVEMLDSQKSRASSMTILILSDLFSFIHPSTNFIRKLAPVIPLPIITTSNTPSSPSSVGSVSSAPRRARGLALGSATSQNEGLSWEAGRLSGGDAGVWPSGATGEEFDDGDER